MSEMTDCNSPFPEVVIESVPGGQLASVSIYNSFQIESINSCGVNYNTI